MIAESPALHWITLFPYPLVRFFPQTPQLVENMRLNYSFGILGAFGYLLV
jgi:hypothetical protein